MYIMGNTEPSFSARITMWWELHHFWQSLICVVTFSFVYIYTWYLFLKPYWWVNVFGCFDFLYFHAIDVVISNENFSNLHNNINFTYNLWTWTWPCSVRGHHPADLQRHVQPARQPRHHLPCPSHQGLRLRVLISRLIEISSFFSLCFFYLTLSFLIYFLIIYLSIFFFFCFLFSLLFVVSFLLFIVSIHFLSLPFSFTFSPSLCLFLFFTVSLYFAFFSLFAFFFVSLSFFS